MLVICGRQRGHQEQSENIDENVTFQYSLSGASRRITKQQTHTKYLFSNSTAVECRLTKCSPYSKLTKFLTVIFSKGRRKYENYHFTYKGNNRIEITDNYKYLGITLFYNENLKHAEDDLYNKVLTEKKAFRSI